MSNRLIYTERITCHISAHWELSNGVKQSTECSALPVTQWKWFVYIFAVTESHTEAVFISIWTTVKEYETQTGKKKFIFFGTHNKNILVCSAYVCVVCVLFDHHHHHGKKSLWIENWTLKLQTKTHTIKVNFQYCVNCCCCCCCEKKGLNEYDDAPAKVYRIVAIKLGLHSPMWIQSYSTVKTKWMKKKYEHHQQQQQ